MELENMKEQFYINSLPYEIELTARICHESAKRLLDSLTKDISIDEFTVLDTIIAKPGLSQADLARILLKGKAHTGRFLMSLEDKKLIERHIDERDGKLIKVAKVTQKGNDLYKQIYKELQPSIAKFEEIIKDEEVQSIIKNLRNLRTAIERVNKIVFE